MSGSERTGPIGRRVSVVKAESPTMKTNFSQMARSMSGEACLRARAGLEQGLRATRLPAAGLSEHQPRHLPAVLDGTGLVEGRRDVADAAHEVLAAERARQHVVRLDSILQGDHCGVGADQRGDLARRFLRAPQLHREEDQVDGADRRRVVGDADRLEVEVTPWARDPQPAFAHRRELPSARDERHVLARLREPAAEVPAHRPASHDRDLHVASKSRDRPDSTP